MTTARYHDQRYRRWQDRPPRWQASWWAIIRHGLRMAQKDAKTRFMLYWTLSFVVGTTSLFYALAMLESLPDQEAVRAPLDLARNLLGIDLTNVSVGPELRATLWRLVYIFALKVELFWVMTTFARVGPPLIAEDIRTRALPIYFARPITPLAYLVSKWVVLAVYVALIVALPNLAALFFGVLLTGGFASWGQIASLTGELLLCAGGVMLVAGSVMLALSAITADKRYANIAWLAVCILPVIVQGAINEALPIERRMGWLGSLSLYHNLLALCEWLFNLREMLAATGLPAETFARALVSPVDPRYPAIVLGTLVALALFLTYRRIVRFSRAAANIA